MNKQLRKGASWGGSSSQSLAKDPVPQPLPSEEQHHSIPILQPPPIPVIDPHELVQQDLADLVKDIKTVGLQYFSA